MDRAKVRLETELRLDTPRNRLRAIQHRNKIARLRRDVELKAELVAELRNPVT